jgi:hypothetical protein
MLFLQIAVRCPTIQIVRGWSRPDVVLGLVHAIQFRLLAGMHTVCLATSRDLPFAANHRNARAVTVLIYIDSERACFLDRKSSVRSIYLI